MANKSIETVVVAVSDQTVSACSAAVAGALSTVILYPLETIKTRMQAMKGGDKKEKPSMAQVFEQVKKDGGLAALYSGVYVKALQSSITKSMYFYIFAMMGGGSFKTVFAELFTGYMAELVSLPLMMPLEVVGNKMIVSKKSVTPQKVISDIVAESGVAGFYSGLGANVVNAIQPAIHFGIFEQIKKSILNDKKTQLGFLESFVYGGVARAISTMIFFPTIRAKVIAGTDPDSKHLSPMEIIMGEVKKAGVVGLYNGVQPELIRGVLSTALTMAIKERVADGVKNFLPLVLALFLSRQKAVKK